MSFRLQPDDDNEQALVNRVFHASYLFHFTCLQDRGLRRLDDTNVADLVARHTNV